MKFVNKQVNYMHNTLHVHTVCKPFTFQSKYECHQCVQLINLCTMNNANIMTIMQTNNRQVIDTLIRRQRGKFQIIHVSEPVRGMPRFFCQLLFLHSTKQYYMNTNYSTVILNKRILLDALSGSIFFKTYSGSAKGP